MNAFSFCLLAREVKKFGRLAAPDFRGHGLSKHKGGDEDLSMATLVSDGLEILDFMMEEFPESTFVITGHSMGGSIACRVAKVVESNPATKRRIVGLILIDVVEGTAIEALPYMEAILLKRPKFFSSLSDVVAYA